MTIRPCLVPLVEVGCSSFLSRIDHEFSFQTRKILFQCRYFTGIDNSIGSDGSGRFKLCTGVGAKIK